MMAHGNQRPRLKKLKANPPPATAPHHRGARSTEPVIKITIDPKLKQKIKAKLEQHRPKVQRTLQAATSAAKAFKEELKKENHQ